MFAGQHRAFAQIDPEKRQLIQIGYNQPLEGKGPIAGYAYYYLNQPEFVHTNLTLRLAIAPVYLDSELGIAHALGQNTDLGIGLAGGGFADSFSEVRGGKYLREDSFTGHGGEISVSLYHLFNPGDLIPLYGIIHNNLHQSIFERDDGTASNFVLPQDQTTYHLRAGMRWGGREPKLMPELAMEVSAWYEGQFRSRPGPYGYSGDRRIESNSHLFWARALLIYTFPESKQTFSVNLTGGGSLHADRFSAYRLGSVLPLASEFPLTLPGYYFQEITADRFVLAGGEYLLPLDKARRWSLSFTAATAAVDYLPGMAQPGDWLSGVGGGITYRSPSQAWQISLGYAYGFDAIRSSGRGANSIGFLCQFDLGAEKRARNADVDPSMPPRSRGLFHLFD